MRQLSASCDWSRERFTLDQGLSGELGHCQTSFKKTLLLIWPLKEQKAHTQPCDEERQMQLLIFCSKRRSKARRIGRLIPCKQKSKLQGSVCMQKSVAITIRMGSLEVECKYGCAEAVQEAFVQLHKKGLVYRGSYLVNWSPNLQTAVSDLEVGHPCAESLG